MSISNQKLSVIDKLCSHKLQLDFHIKVHKVNLKGLLSTLLKVTWKRRKKLVQTFDVSSNTQEFEYNEILTMVNTIYFKSSKALPKIAELKVLGKKEFGWQEIGRIVLNLSDYIEKPVNEQEFPLENCQNSSITLSISTKISALSKKIFSEPSVPGLEKQINEVKDKLKRVETDLESVIRQKEEIKGKMENLNSELKKIQNTGMRDAQIVIKGENLYLKRVLKDLEMEINQEQKKGIELNKYFDDIDKEQEEVKRQDNESKEIEKIIKRYWENDGSIKY